MSMSQIKSITRDLPPPHVVGEAAILCTKVEKSKTMKP